MRQVTRHGLLPWGGGGRKGAGGRIFWGITWFSAGSEGDQSSLTLNKGGRGGP